MILFRYRKEGNEENKVNIILDGKWNYDIQSMMINIKIKL